MSDDERKFYESVVHNLRSQGWGRVEAENEAYDKLMRLRQKQTSLSPRPDID